MHSTLRLIPCQPAPSSSDRGSGQVQVLPMIGPGRFGLLIGPPHGKSPHPRQLFLNGHVGNLARRYLQGEGWPRPDVRVHSGGDVLALLFAVHVPIDCVDTLLGEILREVRAEVGRGVTR